MLPEVRAFLDAQDRATCVMVGCGGERWAGKLCRTHWKELAG